MMVTRAHGWTHAPSRGVFCAGVTLNPVLPVPDGYTTKAPITMTRVGQPAECPLAVRRIVA